MGVCRIVVVAINAPKDPKGPDHQQGHQTTTPLSSHPQATVKQDSQASRFYERKGSCSTGDRARNGDDDPFFVVPSGLTIQTGVAVGAVHVGGIGNRLVSHGEIGRREGDATESEQTVWSRALLLMERIGVEVVTGGRRIRVVSSTHHSSRQQQ